MISHNIEEVFEVSDRIIVLRLGRNVATFVHDETTPQEVVAAIVGVARRRRGDHDAARSRTRSGSLVTVAGCSACARESSARFPSSSA